MLTILEHPSSRYAPRTCRNARSADLTVAIALDFDTAGERLTRKAAGARYVSLSLLWDTDRAAAVLIQALQTHSVQTLNIAGNSISTLAKTRRGWTQERADAYLFALLKEATFDWPVGRVICGGQTGIDLAGAIAAHTLSIPVQVMLPKGFVQRGPDHQDRMHTADDIRAQIESGAARLRADARREPGHHCGSDDAAAAADRHTFKPQI